MRLIVLCFLIGVSSAFAQDRFALVIGVKDYVHVPPLKNTLSDAQDMAGVLRERGFTVLELYNPKTKREMQEALRKYYDLLAGNKNSTGLVFYSGHGMQVKGVNYLIPTESNPQLEADLDDQTLKMEYLMGVVEQAGNPLNIFVLDACRNNPFRSFTRTVDPGLNQVNAPKGSYVVYATAPGSVASDGTGRNGLFTSKLLKYINTPNLELEKVFKYVARDVQAESGGHQIPWINFSYFGDFIFAGSKTENNVAASVEPSETVRQIYDKGMEYNSKGDYHEAMQQFRKAADQGYAPAQHEIGRMYHVGNGVTQNFTEAAVWYRKAVKQDYGRSQNNLGILYESGDGVSKDDKEAASLYRKAADQGLAAAQNSLAGMYYEGKGVAQSYAEAAQLYSKSAEQGNAGGQVGLGFLFETGKGTKQDYSEAVYWYRKAADQGFAEGQTSLGLMYSEGLGVSKDVAVAYSWFKKAADQGNVAAQCNVGQLLWTGQGVAQDHKQAAYWYRKAADQGYATAQNRLASFYENGIGVETDLNTAIMYYKKAASQGYELAKVNLKRLGVKGY